MPAHEKQGQRGWRGEDTPEDRRGASAIQCVFRAAIGWRGSKDGGGTLRFFLMTLFMRTCDVKHTRRAQLRGHARRGEAAAQVGRIDGATASRHFSRTLAGSTSSSGSETATVIFCRLPRILTWPPRKKSISSLASTHATVKTSLRRRLGVGFAPLPR